MQINDNSYSYYAGIDISKDTFDVSVVDQDGTHLVHKQFVNNQKGFKDLVSLTKKQGWMPVLFAMEGTGGCEQELLDYLYKHKQAVSRQEPCRIHYHRLSQGSRQKTDYVDSLIIADYALKNRLRLYNPKGECYRSLQEIGRTRRMLVKHQNSLQQRLSHAQNEHSITVLTRSIDHCKEDIQLLNSAAAEIIASDDKLAEDRRLLNSIPGVGDITSNYFLGLIGDISCFSTSAKLVRFVGMNPCPHQSGTSIMSVSRISKMGDPLMRSLLYTSAMVVLQMLERKSTAIHPSMYQFVARMRKRFGPGSGNKVLCAVMRKLLILMWTVLTRHKAYDPCYGLEPQDAQANQTLPSDDTDLVQLRAGAAPVFAGEGNEAGQDRVVQGSGCMDGEPQHDCCLSMSG